MKISRIIDLIEGELLTGHEIVEEDVGFGYGWDLMGDLRAFVTKNVLLLTGLIHPQVIRTAEMLDIRAIIFVRGKRPSEELIEMAKARDIALIATKHAMFTASGILYSHGLKGEEITHDEITL